MSSPPAPSLTVLAVGRIGESSLESLVRRFPSVERIDLELPGDAVLSSQAGTVNRAVDGAHAPWILIVREREHVDEALADEIVRSIRDNPAAWAFRIRTQPHYLTRPIVLGRQDEGSIRLFHRRHARLDATGAREMALQGTVVRLREALRGETFSTRAEHEAYLRGRGIPHSAIRRVLLFCGRWLHLRGWRGGRSAATYLWIEAGWDLTDPASGVSSAREI